MNIKEAIKLNKKSGSYFFNPETMRFWDSKIETDLIEDKYFITSEKTANGKDRKFTIREFNGDYSIINDIGEFLEHSTLSDAEAALTNYLEKIKNYLRKIVQNYDK